MKNAIQDWLQVKKTLEEIEADHTITDERLGAEPVVFGFMHEKWLQFRQEIQPGDELWEFSSSPESWLGLAGRAGVALVRDGKVVAFLCTRIS